MDADPDQKQEQVHRIGAGILSSEVLRAAVEAQLFEVLGARSMMAPEISDYLAMSPSVVHDFLEALVANGLLSSIGEGPEDSEYRSTADPATLAAVLGRKPGFP